MGSLHGFRTAIPSMNRNSTERTFVLGLVLVLDSETSRRGRAGGFMVPMRAQSEWRLSMNRSSTGRIFEREAGKLRQVLDCASPLALSVSPGRTKSCRGLPHSKTLARHIERLAVHGPNACQKELKAAPELPTRSCRCEAARPFVTHQDRAFTGAAMRFKGRIAAGGDFGLDFDCQDVT